MLDIDLDFSNTQVRAVTFLQPYASLMLHGRSDVRTYDADYRGLVLICAGWQALTDYDIYHKTDMYTCNKIHEVLDSRTCGWRLGLGKAIAIGELVNSRPMAPEDEKTSYEKYFKGLWSHVYRNVVPIKPFKWKGRQGLIPVPEEFRKKIQVIENKEESWKHLLRA